jgi:hypothetical protein
MCGSAPRWRGAGLYVDYQQGWAFELYDSGLIYNVHSELEACIPGAGLEFVKNCAAQIIPPCGSTSRCTREASDYVEADQY